MIGGGLELLSKVLLTSFVRQSMSREHAVETEILGNLLHSFCVSLYVVVGSVPTLVYTLVCAGILSL